jgi:hypothetical protein
MKAQSTRFPAGRPGRLSLSQLARGLLLPAVMALTACATTQAPSPAAHPVVERAEQRWEALLSGDLETAYTYLSPGYRSTVSVIEFGASYAMRKVKLTDAEYQSHECESARCEVAFLVQYEVLAPVPGVDRFSNKGMIRETWVKTDGQWWFLPDK